MNRLAVETATDFCSVAIEVDGEVRVREALAPRRHAELLLPWVRELLAETGIDFPDLDTLAVSRGPGGFTSLRIGLGVVQGLGLALDLPVHVVSTLSVLARAADPACKVPHILAVLDARMSEVYSGWFRSGPKGHELIGSEQVGPPGRLVPPHAGPWLAAGSGLDSYSEVIEPILGDGLAQSRRDIWPDARSLLALAEAVEPMPAWQIEPKYVRDQVTG